jgi:hypothetical protein
LLLSCVLEEEEEDEDDEPLPSLVLLSLLLVFLWNKCPLNSFPFLLPDV